MSRPSRTRLYWETVRHLRPVQIYGRAWFHIVHPQPDLRPAPQRRKQKGTWSIPARRRPSLLGPNEFRFLNEARTLSEQGWDNPAIAKLWRYNLHYFDDLNAQDAAERTGLHRTLIAHWITENPPGGGTGWEPYPTSLRIVNWIKWALADNTLAPEVLHSLAVQTRWLSRRLEYHLLGNHLFANAKALVFAGCFFEGDEAESWLARGMRILAREIQEQILPDGGQFELSPMYHALALEDMLDLFNIVRTVPIGGCWQAQIDGWRTSIETMQNWLVAMCHPDGEIAFFNDAAIGIAPSPAELDLYAARLGFARPTEAVMSCAWLHDSGYIRLQGARAVVLLDVAQVGPDYLPGHAHADTLSFELSVEGERILVNSGTSIYGTCPERLRQRGTAAHNTVTIDGENSSEVWSGFRVARRAHPQGLSVEREGNEWLVACAHEGYRRLAGKPLHRRSWRFGGERLVISDTVEGGHRHAEAAFHFHPDIIPSLDDNNGSGVLTSPSGVVLRWNVDHGTARLEPSTWHPEFGVSLASSRLVIALTGGKSSVEFSWVVD